MAWMALIYLTVLAVIAVWAVLMAVEDAKVKRDGAVDESWSVERRAYLRERAKRDGTWEPLRDWEGP